jgi:hypothetical protein
MAFSCMHLWLLLLEASTLRFCSFPVRGDLPLGRKIVGGEVGLGLLAGLDFGPWWWPWEREGDVMDGRRRPALA